MSENNLVALAPSYTNDHPSSRSLRNNDRLRESSDAEGHRLRCDSWHGKQTNLAQTRAEKLCRLFNVRSHVELSR